MPTKLVLSGIVIGVLSGISVAQFDPGATLAAVAENPPFSLGKTLDTHLAKFDGDYYAIGTKPGVTLDGATIEVEKIGYGQTSIVTVVKTPSGTYSTDGLKSPNVRYPGVFTQRMHVFISPFAAAVLGWSKLTGWTKIPLFSANSFGFLNTDSVPASQHGVCMHDNQTDACT